MPQEHPAIDRALWALAELARARPEIAAEEPPARAAFFGTPAALAPPDDLAEQRFLEWFLLERPSSTLDAVPVEVIARTAEDDTLASALRERYASLRNSQVGVFQVTDIEAGQGFWVRDLFGSGQFPISDPNASSAMAEGDLIVGRLFPGDDEAFVLSRTAGCFRNPDLAQAIERDLERLRQGRRGPVRMQQIELEAMFFGSRALAGKQVGDRAAGDPVGDARALLMAAGLSDTATAALFAELRDTPFEAPPLVPVSGGTLGLILDQLAFETDVDLEAARRLLLAAWPVLRGESTPAPASPHSDSARDVATALHSFEIGRAAGRDLEGLFKELEHDLGLDPDEDADPGDLLDFPGVMTAMVEEFLWDTAREEGDDVRERYASLRALSRFGTHIGVFENFARTDLLRFLSFWVPESGEFQGADEMAELLHALAAFVHWARTSHQLDRLDGAEELIADMRDTLPRIQRVNAELASAPDEVGALFVIRETLQGPFVRVDSTKDETFDAEIEPASVAPLLQAGDRLRARRAAGGRLALLRAYPAAIAELDESLG